MITPPSAERDPLQSPSVTVASSRYISAIHCNLIACSFRWFIVAESTVRWFIVRKKYCWMTADLAE
jgi:hypothetical protein